MSLVNSCGHDYALDELIKATIGVATANGHKFVKVTVKTEAPFPECSKHPSFEEKLKGAISIVVCPEGNYIAINTIEIPNCDCLICGTDIPCNEADLPVDKLLVQCFGYTTDGEWALRIANVTDDRT